MKKLILLTMILGLFMVGEAGADGAWVLWKRGLRDKVKISKE
jgi:hypothetical protein